MAATKRKPQRRAFTLAESLTASVVLAAAVIGISGTLSASYQQSDSRDEATTGLLLARELMEEVASRPMDPSGSTNASGWPTVTNRALYDTIDDYSGYTDTSTSVKASDGTVMDLAAGQTYTRTVTITPGARPTGLTGTTTDFMLAKVTVTTPHGQNVSVSQLFTRATVLR
jgi:Tfp pilus assembly protein PilV